MRPLYKAETLQIEWTSRCVRACANCTHFSGSYYNHPEITFDQFKEAIDSLVDYPSMIGSIGGEPLLHPDFEKMCEYALTKIPRERHGLWTTLPKGKEHYAELICNTFGHIFINNHERSDIYHAPILVASQEYFKDRKDLFLAVDDCWLGNSWSPCVNTKGAFFCEVAASMSQLFDGPEGWPIEPGWWKRTPKDYHEQIEEWCPKCGCAMPLFRRKSTEDTDDISIGNLELLKGKSRKVDKGLVQISDFSMDASLLNNMYPNQTYKDQTFRDEIAARYGMFLTVNARQYNEPHMLTEAPKARGRVSIFEEYKQRFGT